MRKDGQFWRGIALLVALLAGGPLLIALLGGVLAFAGQPARFNATLHGTEAAAAAQPLALTLALANETNGPLILWSLALDAQLLAALGEPEFDPPPYQTQESATGDRAFLFNLPVDAGSALAVQLSWPPVAVDSAAGLLTVCRPGDARGCTAVPVALTFP